MITNGANDANTNTFYELTSAPTHPSPLGGCVVINDGGDGADSQVPQL